MDTTEAAKPTKEQKDLARRIAWVIAKDLNERQGLKPSEIDWQTNREISADWRALILEQIMKAQ